MQKYIVLVGFMLVLCAPMLLAGKPRERDGNRDGNKENRQGLCRYKPERTSGTPEPQCDPATNTRTITKKLVSGDAATCQPTITIQKRCKNRRVPRAADAGGPGATDSRCKYRKGQKGECNAETSKRVITMQLKRNSPASCPPTKIMEKSCRPKPAKPEKGERRRNGRPNRRNNDE